MAKPLGKLLHSCASSVAVLALLTACGKGTHEGRPIIGVVQVSALAPLDEAREGFYKALADSGFVRDVNVTFLERNAQGDIPTLSLIMRDFVQQGATQVATLSSIATQTAMKVITDRPIVFGAVANPYAINAGTSPTNHRPNVTGAEIPLPVDSALGIARAAFPKAGAWGTLFDPADPFAEFYLDMAKRKAAQLGMQFVTVACTSPQDIASGVQALHAQGAGGVMQIPSIMIGGGFPALIKQARELGMPVVASNTGYPGPPLALGASFYDNGYAQGLIMIRVLRGENPANIPFRVSATPQMVVDLGAAADFGVTIPPTVIERASKVIPATETGDTVRGASPKPSSAAPNTSRRPSAWDYWLSALVLGLAFATLAWGVYIASRVLRFPDITPDGSFPLGAAVAATLIFRGVDPLPATVVAFFAGMVAGWVTGVLHTRLRVNELLAGILVMTALYSVNLHVMGRSNISLLDRATLATRLHALVPTTAAWPNDISFGVVFLGLMIVLGFAFTWFLRTDFGTAMRAAGDNPAMIIAQGVDRRGMVELALALANGLVAFSGALIAQYQGFADVTMGVGTLVAGMAAVILGETLKPRKARLGVTIAMVAVGAIVFRGLIAVALRVGLDPVDLKLATAAFVLATLALPTFRLRLRQGRA
ncbi:MAG TPA: ABC transporter substrate binding protein [Gemmatimonadaceae bacterium]|jgi:putative ABC transport system permease protein|nr:ABC transporter substrate binding protein [Gemmatimonadaceae bacterium]